MKCLLDRGDKEPLTNSSLTAGRHEGLWAWQRSQSAQWQRQNNNQWKETERMKCLEADLTRSRTSEASSPWQVEDAEAVLEAKAVIWGEVWCASSVQSRYNCTKAALFVNELQLSPSPQRWTNVSMRSNCCLLITCTCLCIRVQGACPTSAINFAAN